ncbi:MAG: CehA/McbA family metallohydrolase [Firmicutes bacterium]|nr:CehA/McbA family metallohydrolase [Bacillota bacterium]
MSIPLLLKGILRLHVYTGNIHVHSTHSDGHGSIPEIAAAAKAAGLDFIVITDHNTLAGLPEEGYYQGVLTLCGAEVNNEKHHCLALNISEPVPTDDQDPQRVIDAISGQGGLSFIAHPFEHGSPLVMNGLHFPWKRWDIDGFTGVEVWNWCSQWRDAVQGVFQALYIGYLNPAGPIKGPCPKALARFDEISQRRPLVAIAGSDNHAWPVNRWGILRRVIFPYVYAFRTANNCLLLEEPLAEDFAVAKAQIYGALRRGRSFIVNRLLGDPQGFSFTAGNGGQEYQMGEQVPLDDRTLLEVRCQERPGLLRYRLFHNGLLLDEIPHCNATVRIQSPGVYRLEVWRGDRLWILTNPIYINEGV